MKPFLFVCLLAASALQARSPQLPPSPPLKLEVPAFGERSLSCGLKVLWREDKKLPLVSCSLMLPGGYIEEPEGKEGLLRLLRRLLRDGGAGQLDPEQFDAAVADRAADLWAGAEPESFTAGFKCLSEDLDALLGLFADMLLRPRLDAKRLEVARAALLNLLSRMEDKPVNAASVLASRGYFSARGYGSWPTAKSAKALQREDLLEFFKAKYGPVGGVLVLSGNFDSEKALARLEELFKGWKSGGGSIAPTAVELKGQRILFFAKEAPQAQILLSLPGIRRHDPTDFALDLANNVFGRGFNSRLVRTFRSDRGLAYSIGSHYAHYVVQGPFTIEGSTRPDAVSEYLKLLFQNMRDYAAQGPTAKELKEAKTAMIQFFACNFASIHSLAEQKLRYVFENYPADYLETYRDKIQAVTREEAAAAARRIWGQDRWIMAVSGPASLEKELEAFGPVTVMKSVSDPL